MGEHTNDTPLDERDAKHLRHAIRLSAEARQRGNAPYGAVVVGADGIVLAEARNTGAETDDFTAHAEMNALRLLGGRHPRELLAGATVYASGEPCAMCAGAIFWSGIGRVVFALDIEGQQRTGKPPEIALSCRQILGAAPRRIEVVGPCLAQEAARPYQGMWSGR
ncbi:nucleoside deaminase [Azohydromonas caseinilytica]|uniref:Nucleoside deaminase n=1 Tax=Azohydromonas caseinilytica TaxID=2728836 RepID=A0A848FDZ9_9BURK|nr:nucleoside deaminase [Azohydromonas caseinilytica]NML16599.1 nucleoside deaminase [Azohydromonas caseinilytica]